MIYILFVLCSKIQKKVQFGRHESWVLGFRSSLAEKWLLTRLFHFFGQMCWWFFKVEHTEGAAKHWKIIKSNHQMAKPCLNCLKILFWLIRVYENCEDPILGTSQPPIHKCDIYYCTIFPFLEHRVICYSESHKTKGAVVKKNQLSFGVFLLQNAYLRL